MGIERQTSMTTQVDHVAKDREEAQRYIDAFIAAVNEDHLDVIPVGRDIGCMMRDEIERLRRVEKLNAPVPSLLPEEAKPAEQTFTQKMRGRPVTHDEAMASADRLINSRFGKANGARCSIPARPDDDDIVIVDYITEQRAKAARSEQVGTK